MSKKSILAAQAAADRQKKTPVADKPRRHDTRQSRLNRIAARGRPSSLTNPPVLTPDELAQGATIQAGFDALVSRHATLTHTALGDDWKMAAEKYQADPSQQNFVAMKQAALERSFFRADHRARTQVKISMRAFLAQNLIPWALAIAQRNIAAAGAAFQKVHAVENARCMRLTGRPIQLSDIVQAAEKPLRHLEQIKASLLSRVAVPGSLPTPARVLEMFRAVGDANFEALVSPELTPEQVDELVAQEERERVESSEEAENSAADEGQFPHVFPA